MPEKDKRKAPPTGGPGGPGGRGGMNPAEALKSLVRVAKLLFRFYPVAAPLLCAGIVFSSVVAAIPSLFQQKILAAIEVWYTTRNWAGARPEILHYIVVLVIVYILAIVSSVMYTQLGAVITQGFLDKMRRTMFNKMQNLPIRYFDTNKHGDIMSHYTNDVDTLRQLVSQVLPSVLSSGIIVLVALGIMLYFSLWLTLVVLLGIAAMYLTTKVMGAGSAKYFMRMQRSVAETEGFIQELINGQKVVKVFNHEEQSIADFDAINTRLSEEAFRAHAYANVLGPINANIGNILYVALALVGGMLYTAGVKNLSLSGMALSISVLVPFLNMSRQFTGNINNLTQQINSVVMAGAGAKRVFELMDAEDEADEGYVTLVNAGIGEDGTVREADHRTGHWAWKHPHAADGTVTYTELKGDVRLTEVDFGYEENKQVLYDVSVWAEPGQKVAFVGATGAGKTTITNLINRFYDIADGKIRYDGININKIRKSDLRRSLGVVLQETNLFTGTVMENIRYGKLDATDEECINAAKLAGADDFITRLPQGYETELANNGANLSQGQRQLIAIARAAVADPPVMILDEATSSIDTRTEAIVQRGMDKLMEGRTVFVIAHRLSTVKNSDVIMVLDHGRIIERGSHEKLIAERGTYYRLYTGAFELE